MSFILDALKKSEADRQEQTGAEFSSVPSSSGNPQSFKWLWILGLLLAVNFVFLAGILISTDKTPDTPAVVAEEPPAPATRAAEPSFEEQVASAKESLPARTAPAPVQAGAIQAGAVQTDAAATVQRPAGERVLTIDEVRVNGTLQITDLHLDIHVYSDEPAERFVFINMDKHREGSQLDEGPVVSQITPDGVILKHQGTTFLLPRE
jgi:general secretion pathway protein B